jgi:uncharacterized Rossmann fold enzyme
LVTYLSYLPIGHKLLPRTLTKSRPVHYGIYTKLSSNSDTITQSIRNIFAISGVKFVDWFPYYQNIRAEFGYSTEKDQEAANVLSKMIKRKALDVDILKKKISGKQVMVIGAGPSLEDKIGFIKQNRNFVKIAEDGVAQALIENKIKPDIVVTDLDGDPLYLQRAEKMGSIMVVHAHGDNIDRLGKMVPKFKRLVGSTQVMPVENVYNFGGFTDGDRAVYLAEEFEAGEIVLVAMDFGTTIGKYSKNPIDIDVKRQKFKAGKKLLEILAKQSRSRLVDTSTRPIKGFATFENLDT